MARLRRGTRKSSRSGRVRPTKRKRTEQGLRESEERHRLIIENINEVICLINLENDPFKGTVQFVSPQVENILGYRPEEFVQDPGLWLQMVHPDDVPALVEATQKILASREIGIREYRLRHKRTAEYHWMADKVVPLLDEQGRVVGIQCVAHDITERKRTEDTLRRCADEFTALYAISLDMTMIRDLPTLLNTIVGRIVGLLDINTAGGAVYLCDPDRRELHWMAGYRDPSSPVLKYGEGAAGTVAQTGEPLIIDNYCVWPGRLGDFEKDQSFITVLSVPMSWQDEMIGVLQVSHSTPSRPFTKTDVALITLFANQAAVAVKNARLFEELQSSQSRLQVLSRQLIHAQETERHRIARELHDEIGQALTVIKINVHAAQRAGNSAPLLTESLEMLDRTLQQVRELSFDLRPSILDDLGLAAALRWYVKRLAQRVGFVVYCTVDIADERLPPELETVCFRVAQEALTNVVRHAHPQHVHVVLRQSDAGLELGVIDDGAGFDVDAVRKHIPPEGNLGLLSMQERVQLLGGQIEIKSAPQQGTTVMVRFPITR